MWAESSAVENISARNSKVQPPWVASPSPIFWLPLALASPHEQTEMVWNMSRRWMPARFDTPATEWRVPKIVIQHMVQSIWTHSQHFARCPQWIDGFPMMDCNLWCDPGGLRISILHSVCSRVIGFWRWTPIYDGIHVDTTWAFYRTSAAEWWTSKMNCNLS